LVSKVVENVELLEFQTILLWINFKLIGRNELLSFNIIIFAQILKRSWLMLTYLLLLSLDLDRGDHRGAL
jgi:hypothetical protein